MEKSNLIPFVRDNLDILFIGLNPAKGSNQKRHYFSVNQAFWDQLNKSGLINFPVIKSIADEIIFGATNNNFHGWSFGITDLVTDIAESDSGKIKPSNNDCQLLYDLIVKISPKVIVFLHQKAVKYFFSFIEHPIPENNSGMIGKIIEDSQTMLFTIAFPHGNKIPSQDKINQYILVKEYLERLEAQ